MAAARWGHCFTAVPDLARLRPAPQAAPGSGNRAVMASGLASPRPTAQPATPGPYRGTRQIPANRSAAGGQVARHWRRLQVGYSRAKLYNQFAESHGLFCNASPIAGSMRPKRLVGPAAADTAVHPASSAPQCETLIAATTQVVLRNSPWFREMRRQRVHRCCTSGRDQQEHR